jgi:hypothetical protein
VIKKWCKDCLAEGVARHRPAGYVGPRCYSHHVVARKAAQKAAHELRVTKTYGLTAGEYDRLHAFQGGRCALCRRATGKKRRLAVDHDHATGRPRGLLCGPCNKTVLGFDGELIRRAVAYLTHPPYDTMRSDAADDAALGDVLDLRTGLPVARSGCP